MPASLINSSEYLLCNGFHCSLLKAYNELDCCVCRRAVYSVTGWLNANEATSALGGRLPSSSDENDGLLRAGEPSLVGPAGEPLWRRPLGFVCLPATVYAAHSCEDFAAIECCVLADVYARRIRVERNSLILWTTWKKGGSAGVRISMQTTRPSVRLAETDADASRPTSEHMAELRRSNELLRQQLQQAVSLPSTWMIEDGICHLFVQYADIHIFQKKLETY